MRLSHAFRRLLAMPAAVVAVLCATAGNPATTASAVDGAGPAPVVHHVEIAPKRAKGREGVWSHYLRR